MKLKRELENREKKPIIKLSIGETFVYEGMLHLTIGVTEGSYTFAEMLNANYRLAVNLQDNVLRQIRNDVEVVPVRAEIISE